MQLFGLTGFLGLPSDLAPFHTKVLLDFFSPSSHETNFSLPTLAQHFLQALSCQKITGPYGLLGYSFGARVLLHTLESAPFLNPPPSFYILISGSFGNDFASKEEKQNRWKSDQLWAKRFLNEDWEHLMQGWNNQPIFKNTAHAIRHEKDFSRCQLAKSLLEGSISHQRNFTKTLQNTPLPIAWLAGAYDNKFTSIAHAAEKMHPHIQAWIIPQAGHRIIWDQETAIQNIITLYQKKTQQKGDTSCGNP